MKNERKSATEMMYSTFAELLTERINLLREDWNHTWLRAVGNGMPRQLNGRQFKPANSLMLLLWCGKKGYTHPIFVTKRQIRALNERRGKREPIITTEGEPFPVCATIGIWANGTQNRWATDSEYKRMRDEEKEDFSFLTRQYIVNVYNIAQTNIATARPDLYERISQADPIKGVSKPRGKLHYAPLDYAIGNDAWITPIKPMCQDQSYYSISNDEIVTPELRQFRNGETFMGLCFHEMAHSTGKESFLNRFDDKKGWGTTKNFYAREELLAELTSALLCARIRVWKLIKEESALYLLNWAELMQEKDFLKDILADINKVYPMIAGHLDMTQRLIDSKQEEQKKEIA